MKLYIKQKVFSWGDRFCICDELGNDQYYAEGEILTLGKKLHLYSRSGNELAFIHQTLLSFLPKYFIGRDGADVAEVQKKLTFLHPEYRVEGPGWNVSGDFLAHRYTIHDNDRRIASVSKRWLSWGDSYEIDIAEEADEVMALCVVLIVDAVMDQSSRKTSASHD